MTAATINLQMPNQEHLFEHLKTNAKWAHQKIMIQPKEGTGKRVLICGAGPSLRDHLEDVRTMPAHQVWAANSALPYLWDQGIRPTHGVTVDMSEEMYTDPYEWQRTFPVRYLISSGVDPLLIQHLRKADRRYRMFHSYLGIPDPDGWRPPSTWKPPLPQFNSYEMFLYTTIYPASVQVGYGLNTVPRAICLAIWMGFKEITVFGADCACAPGAPLMPVADDPAYHQWLDQLLLYADGRTARKYGDTAIVTQGIIEGRTWHTRPDMIVSAQHLLDIQKQYPQVTLVGDTLPNALRHMPEEYLVKLPRLSGHGSVEGFQLNEGLDSHRGASV